MRSTLSDDDTMDTDDEDSGHIEQSKKWSVGRKTRTFISDTRKKLVKLSGDDIVPMLRDVLTKREIALLTGEKGKSNGTNSGEKANCSEEENKDEDELSLGEEEEDGEEDDNVCSETAEQPATEGDGFESEDDSDSESLTIRRSRNKKRTLRPRRNSEEAPDDDDDTPRAARARALLKIREKKLSASEKKEETRTSTSASKKRQAISSSSDSEDGAPTGCNSRRSLDFESSKKPCVSYSDEEENIEDASPEPVIMESTPSDFDHEESQDAREAEEHSDSEGSQYSYGDSDASENGEYEEEEGGKKNDEWEYMMKNFRRETPEYRTATDQYLRNSPKKRTPEAKKRKSEIYEPLMIGLRKMASREGLSDPEIVREFVLYETSESRERDGKCLCGKTGLRRLYHMHNKNVEDVIDRACDHTTIVGSECINWFWKALEVDDESPLVLFDNFWRKGVSAILKESVVTQHHHEDLVFTLTGKSSQFLLKNREAIAGHYDLPIKYSGENAVQLTVCPGKYATHVGALKPCSKYRIFLKCNIEAEKLPYSVSFELTRFTDSRQVEREREVKKKTSGKSFIA